MKIAVACQGLDVAEHLPSATNFTCYFTESFKIVSVQNLPIINSSVDEWAEALANIGIDILLVNKADDFTLQLFTSRGIEVFSSFTGTAKEAVQSFLSQRSHELDLEFKNHQQGVNK